MKPFDFDTENRKGMTGERFMARRRRWKRLSKKGPDFRTPKGSIAELKTDYRALETGKIFVER